MVSKPINHWGPSFLLLCCVMCTAYSAKGVVSGAHLRSISSEWTASLHSRLVAKALSDMGRCYTSPRLLPFTSVTLAPKCKATTHLLALEGWKVEMT